MKRGFGWRCLGLLLSISTLTAVGCADPESQGTENFSGLTLIPPNRTVEEGDSFQLAVQRVENGRSDYVTQSTTWTLSDPAIAAVNSEGALTATKPGISRITAQVDGLSVSTSVYVLGRPRDIQLSPTTVRLAPGTTTSLSTTVISEDNTKRAISGDEAWASSAPDYARAAGSTVQAVKPGKAAITLSYRARAFTRQVHVLNVTLDKLEPGSAQGPQLVEGQSTALFASGRFTGRTESNEPLEHVQDVSNYVAFAPAAKADEDFVSVSGNTLTALKPGRAVIKAVGRANTVAKDKEAQFTVEVLAAPSSIALVGPTKASLRGEPLTVSVEGTTGTTTLNVSSMATLKAEPAGIVNISGTTLTPLKAGEVTLTATVGAAEATRKATMTLLVEDAPFTSMALTILTAGNTGTVAVGQPLRLRSTATFQPGVTQIVTRQVLWLSDNPAVAVVDNAGGASGTVTGLSAGTATIEAYYRGQRVGSQQITVTPTP